MLRSVCLFITLASTVFYLHSLQSMMCQIQQNLSTLYCGGFTTAVFIQPRGVRAFSSSSRLAFLVDFRSTLARLAEVGARAQRVGAYSTASLAASKQHACTVYCRWAHGQTTLSHKFPSALRQHRPPTRCRAGVGTRHMTYDDAASRGL
jgi:hypothetical protein